MRCARARPGARRFLEFHLRRAGHAHRRGIARAVRSDRGGVDGEPRQGARHDPRRAAARRSAPHRVTSPARCTVKPRVRRRIRGPKTASRTAHRAGSHNAPMPLDPHICYRALQAHDRRFDGKFFVGVSSTGIYCRPVCTVRAPRRGELPLLRERGGRRGRRLPAVPALPARARAGQRRRRRDGAARAGRGQSDRERRPRRRRHRDARGARRRHQPPPAAHLRHRVRRRRRSSTRRRSGCCSPNAC